MTTIRMSRQDLYLLKDVLDDYSYNELQEINVYVEYDIFEELSPVNFIVNWSCKGSVSAKEALEYAEALTKASRLAMNLDRKNYVYDNNIEDKKITKKEYLEIKANLYEEIKFIAMEVV